MKNKFQFNIISISTYGTGFSGGDRIFIELAKRLSLKFPVNVYVWEEGLKICQREKLTNVKYFLWSALFWPKLGFFVNYLARIAIAIYHCWFLDLENNPKTIVYTASEFWQDTFPAFILKLRFPKITWIAAWYMSAPNPFKGFKENGKKSIFPDIKVLAYWFVQQPVKVLIKNYAGFVFVTSEPDKTQFKDLSKKDRVIVIKGGVDLDLVIRFQKEHKNVIKKYDAVFQGRFHPQKGVFEMIKIWKIVVDQKPSAKLAMIGDGPLMADAKLLIKKYNLQKNVKLFGYVFDGTEKFKIFLQSKIVVHPAVYDSGGMAAAEAMAFGLPGVSFDLEALKTYYPSGMIKIPLGNSEMFAETLLNLLKDKAYYKKISGSATKLIKDKWSWDNLSKTIINRLEKPS